MVVPGHNSQPLTIGELRKILVKGSARYQTTSGDWSFLAFWVLISFSLLLLVAVIAYLLCNGRVVTALIRYAIFGSNILLLLAIILATVWFAKSFYYIRREYKLLGSYEIVDIKLEQEIRLMESIHNYPSQILEFLRARLAIESTFLERRAIALNISQAVFAALLAASLASSKQLLPQSVQTRRLLYVAKTQQPFHSLADVIHPTAIAVLLLFGVYMISQSIVRRREVVDRLNWAISQTLVLIASGAFSSVTAKLPQKESIIKSNLP